MVPSLHDLCIASAAEGSVWQKQRRSLYHLPEEAANTLLARLVAGAKLTRPHHLGLFSHCVTHLRLDGHIAAAVDQTWVSYIKEFGHLQTLELEDCPRLRDAHLAGISQTALCSLRVLRLCSCKALTRSCLAHLSGLSSLTSLDMTECTGLASPLPLHHLSTTLRHLALGGIPALRDDVCGAILEALPQLQQLQLWGASVTTEGVQLLAFCTQLQQLDISWTHVDMLPAAISSLTALHMQHCQLQGVWAIDDMPGTALHLRQLNLSSCMLNSCSAAVSRALARTAGSLEQLDLSGVKGLDDLSFLSQATQLTQLVLDGPRPTASLEPLAGAQQLRCLHVTGIDMRPLQEQAVAAGGDIAAAMAAAVAAAISVFVAAAEAEDGHVGSGSVPQSQRWLLSLQHLTELSLQGCHLDDSVLAIICQLPALQHMVLDDNPRLTGSGSTGDLAWQAASRQESDAAWWEPVSIRFPNLLQQMSMERQHGSPAGLVENSSEPGMGDDGAASSNVEQVPLSRWARLQHLQHVSLVGTGVTDAALRQLAECWAAGVGTQLRELRLGSAALTDRGLHALGPSCPVEQLHLQGCSKLAGRGLRHLRACPRLARVTIASCRMIAPSEAATRLLDCPSLLSFTCDSRSWWRATPEARSWEEGGQQTLQPQQGTRAAASPRPGATSSPARWQQPPTSSQPAVGCSSRSTHMAGPAWGAPAAAPSQEAAAYEVDERLRYTQQELLSMSPGQFTSRLQEGPSSATGSSAATHTQRAEHGSGALMGNQVVTPSTAQPALPLHVTQALHSMGLARSV